MTPPLSSQISKHIKHLGARPKSDQDNLCREKLCQYVKDTGCFYEIYPERFYLVYLAKGERLDTLEQAVENDPDCPFILWTDRDAPTLVYEAFNMDFGPYNLAQTHQFCSRVKIWFDTQVYRNPDKVVVIVLDDSNTEKKLNTTLLVAIAGMVLLKMTDEEIIQRLNFFMMYKGKPGDVSKQLVFREKKKFADVSGNPSLMILRLEDCIRAFYAALQHKFYDYYEFDQAEYLFYETVMSGDLNWIIPGKILAFAGPRHTENYNKNPPSFYYHYFKDHNVSSIIRLNDPEYDAEDFTRMGFHHHDLIFPDGYPPTSSIAAKFIKIVDEAPGAVAVHCYAGIGRTGTLIAAYLMARYDFTPQMAIAWTRICRPGSVIGEQQDWLYTKFDPSSVSKGHAASQQGLAGDDGILNKTPLKNRKIKAARTTATCTPPSSPAQIISSPNVKTCPPTPVTRQQAKTTYAVAEKTLGQAKALQLAKKQRENPDRPCTRSHPSVKRNSFEGDTSSSNIISNSNKETNATATSPMTKRAVDVVLDLGRTVPITLNLAELVALQGKRNPKSYSFEDNKYKWKVKFPKQGYVTLKHNYERDSQLINSHYSEPSEFVAEPNIEFRYERTTESSGASNHNTATSATSHTSAATPDAKLSTMIDIKNIPKLKPMAYYSLLQYYT